MVQNSHSKLVKKNFEQNYQEYDEFIYQVVPWYDLIHDQIFAVVKEKFDHLDKFLDLWLGTWTTTLWLLEMFPNAYVDWYDFSVKMLDLAGEKLKAHIENVALIEKDISTIELGSTYDLCISVLAIHHLEEDEKKKLFQKVYESLDEWWMFLIWDRVLKEDESLSNKTNEIYKNHLIHSLWEEEWIKYYDMFDEEDIPSKISDQLHWLQDIWFSETKLCFEYSVYGVFYAIK